MVAIYLWLLFGVTIFSNCSVDLEKVFLMMCVCDVCRDNPLGTGGVLAKRYGELIEDLWTGNSKSITPLKFRVR